MFKYLLIGVLTLRLSSGFSKNNFLPNDSLKQRTDTNKVVGVKLNHWLVSAGYQYRYVAVDFLNIKTNLLGELYNRSTDPAFGKKIYDWKFRPILYQNYVFAGLATKYGSFTASKDINFSGLKQQTTLQSFAVEIPYKQFSFGLSYLKMTGFNRQNPLNDSIVYFKNFTYNPINIYANYAIHKKLNDPLFYLPRKFQKCMSIGIGYNQINISNPNDFIPALKLDTAAGKAPKNVIEVKNVFANEFTSRGMFIALDYDIIIPLLKPKAGNKFKCIYLDLDPSVSFAFQTYKFHIVSDTVSGLKKNAAFFLFKQSSWLTTSYNLTAAAVFDLDNFVISLKGIYQQLNYGLGTSNDAPLRLSTRRFNAFLNLSYRFKMQKINGKIDEVMDRF